MIWNYVLCIIFILCLAAEIYLILKRNRKMEVKGKDDFFAFSLAVLFAMLIFPLTEMENLVENVRNILLLVVIFGTAGVRRGLSARGMEKLCYTIPWEKIQSVHINEYQVSKMQVICETAKGKHKLLFHQVQLKDVLRVIEKHVPNIYIQSSLEKVLDMKKC